jgi:predicted membrane protein (TIGR00267 family)
LSNWIKQLAFLLYITRSRGIARRYVVVNGFDGALTMLGLIMGFHAGGGVPAAVALSACLGAAIALAVSGLSSAYLSEAAERRKALRELESAMIVKLGRSAHGQATRLVPVMIALVNGLSPLVISLLITLPLWLTAQQIPMPVEPMTASIGIAFLIIFLLGIYLGRIEHGFWLWSGIRAVLIAAVTSGVIIAVER